MDKTFALLGTAGYVAPRHLKAIKETGNTLLASMDKSDSVGIVDRYFPKSAFFTEFERFDRHLNKLKNEGNQLDYLSICTPNHLHDSHIRYGLKMGANVICEKPLVINPWNLEEIQKEEERTGCKVFTILQLRLLPQLVALKNKLRDQTNKAKKEVLLSYITPRGHWYYTSWKGNLEKSGGVTTNIGIHLFDLMIWLFGEVQNIALHQHTHDRASGLLELQNANVKWYLSINANHLPQQVKDSGMPSFRSIQIDGEELEFSKGFENLHTKSYQEIIQGNGFEIADAYPSIDLVSKIRTTNISESNSKHPFCNYEITNHPFHH